MKVANKRSKYPSWSSTWVLLFGVFAQLSGCAVIREYPDSWPKPVNYECDDITGRYKNQGENVSKWRVQLANLLIRDDHKFNEINNVFLSVGHSDLAVTPELRNAIEISKTYKINDLNCENGVGTFNFTQGLSGQDSSLGISLYTHEEFNLYILRDKSLVIKRDIYSLGLLLLLIPVYIEETQWHRYFRVE